MLKILVVVSFVVIYIIRCLRKEANYPNEMLLEARKQYGKISIVEIERPKLGVDKYKSKLYKEIQKFDNIERRSVHCIIKFKNENADNFKILYCIKYNNFAKCTPYSDWVYAPDQM